MHDYMIEKGRSVARLAAAARRVALDEARFDEAYRMLDEAGDHPGVAVVRAELLMSEGRPAEARATLEGLSLDGVRTERLRLALDRARRSALARLELGDAEAALAAGQRELALFGMRRAANLDPSWPEPRRLLDELRPRRAR